MEACAHGHTPDPRLALEMHKLRAARVSEEAVEGIHRNFRREVSRATSTSVPWSCATQNLECNLELAEKICEGNDPVARSRFVWNFRCFKSILQKPGRGFAVRRYRRRRMKDKAFKQELHRMGLHSLTTWGGCAAEQSVMCSPHALMECLNASQSGRVEGVINEVLGEVCFA